MEIASIDTIHALKKNAPKESIQSLCFEDTLTISSEAKKRAEWVELVKSMPDIRPDKMHLHISNVAQDAQMLAVAQTIIESGF